MNIYLLNYNNYFNRIVKKEPNIEAYAKYTVDKILVNTNLKPNDGIQTELIVNFKGIRTPDYLVCYEPISKKIISRWFVLDASRTRESQFRLSLRRDVIVDNLDVAMSADAYIEKGYIKQSNPLIFNTEGRKFNQIKVKEDKLFDNTKCAWVVGYYSANQTEPINISGSFKLDSIPSIKTFPLLDLITNPQGDIVPGTRSFHGPLKLDRTNITFNIASFTRGPYWFSDDTYQGFYKSITQNLIDKDSYTTGDLKRFNASPITPRDWTKDMEQTAITQVFNNNNGVSAENVLEIERVYQGIDLREAVSSIEDMFENVSQLDIDESKKQGNFFINPVDGKYYKIEFKNKGSVNPLLAKGYVGRKATSGHDGFYIKNVKMYSYVRSQIDKFVKANGFNTGGVVPGIDPYQMDMISFQTIFDIYDLVVTEVNDPGENFELTIQATSNTLTDAPYKMFCFPYEGKVQVGSSPVLDMNSIKSLVLASAIQKGMQNILFDVQLLPYCPISEWFHEDGMNTLKTDYDIIHTNYELVYKEGKDIPLGVIYFPKKSRFTFDIPYNINTSNISDDYDFKVKRETTLFRLVSPNFANFQSFDPYMNKGVNRINVDCTYKPITPYIKLNIDYKYLYGSDFDDDRGLILGGDFSLPLLTDQWKQYEIQNKNYSNIFDRQQEHLATEHKYSMLGQGIGAISSATNSAAKASNYGPAGMALGAAQSMIGSGFNMAMSQVRFEESRAFAKDMFEFNLQNIQARPQGLVRTSAFNYNNKLVPFIEMYDCTDVEKKNFYNKLKFNGMLIEAIGKPIDYINPKMKSFLKCKVIRFIGLNDDNHMATEIATELDSGIYFQLKEENNGEE